ncbi:MAG: DUF5652 family protein [Patescibacteria group bacterium]
MEQLNLLFTNNWMLFPVLIWTLIWKGYALWIAVKADQKKWYVALLVLNTFGILELIYIFYVAKKNWSDVKAIFSKKSQ